MIKADEWEILNFENQELLWSQEFITIPCSETFPVISDGWDEVEDMNHQFSEDWEEFFA